MVLENRNFARLPAQRVAYLIFNETAILRYLLSCFSRITRNSLPFDDRFWSYDFDNVHTSRRMVSILWPRSKCRSHVKRSRRHVFRISDDASLRDRRASKGNSSAIFEMRKCHLNSLPVWKQLIGDIVHVQTFPF